MQVFVPYPDLKKSVECLDPSRLGNQIYRECLTLARSKWPNHPVSLMWKDHIFFLCAYAFAGLNELSFRGHFYPNIFDKFHEIQMKHKDTGPPPWWNDRRVHNSHKANLLRKDYAHYSQFNWQVKPSEYYFYPQINRSENILRLQPVIRGYGKIEDTFPIGRLYEIDPPSQKKGSLVVS